jgi:tetratricopeptide (TPR) repeat protein
MSITSATLLYSAHPSIAATLAETTLTAASPRTGVLDEIRAEVDRAHSLVLAGNYQEAVPVYQAVRNRIFRLLSPGGPASLAGFAGRFTAPHDLSHLKEMVRASAVLLADLVPGTPEPPVIQADLDPGTIKGYGDGARVLPHAGDEKARRFADLAALGQVAFDNGDYEVAVEHLSAAAEQAGDNPTARASLLLNAGAAAVQAGRLDQANQLLGASLEGFQDARDSLGAAQAAHNLAVVNAASGDVGKTDGAFKETDERSRAAAGTVGLALDVVRSLGRAGNGKPPGNDGLHRSATWLAEPTGGTLVAGMSGGPGTGLDQRASSSDVQQTLGHGAQLIVRDPLVSTAWSSRPLAGTIEQADRAVTYSAGVVLGSTIKTVTWQKAKTPTVDALLAAGYETRLTATTHAGLRATVLTGVDLSVQLAHLFYYVIPIGLAEAYVGLGEWGTARQWLYRAADYPYLNKTLEAPAVWLRIAQTHVGQGDVLYKTDEFAPALAAYGGVVAADGTPGNAPLFTHIALADTGVLVGTLLADPATLPAGLDPGIGAVVLEIAARVRQLAAHLDWFGVPAAFVPPFTFDYLQNAARFLAQQAQAAERDFIQFMERYDTGKLTRVQLDQAAAAAGADEAVANQQAVAAQAEVTLAQTAQNLANTRKANADAARTAYNNMANEQIWLETEIAWYSSQNSWELNNPIPGDGRDIHEVIAADRNRLGQIGRDYELLRMQQTVNELGIAAQQATDQVVLSQARAQATALSAQAASLRRQQAQELAGAFEQSFFTPEVWKQLADFMRQQAQRYQYWATRVARLMERAYEFDFDTTVDRIRLDYSVGAAAGLLGSDQLLADIDYFTYDRITRTTHKMLRASLQVSLAEQFPFAFATGFRRTGEIQFNTLLADLERSYPGSYNHRVQAVEVTLVGLVPPGGLRGTLTNSGVSQYRALDGSTKWRLQDIDTMLLSGYTRNDAMMFRPRPELLSVFEGVGMASGWTLRFPPEINDVDYRFIVDVQVTFHFEAQFDRALAIQVANQPVPPEALRASTSFSLGTDFPDRFFLWQSQGTCTLAIGPEHLPHQHLDPTVRGLSLQLLAVGAAPPPVPLTITAPGGGSADITPDATGRVPSNTPALAALTGSPVRGDWELATTADQDDRAGVYDILLFVEYEFTPRGVA